MLQMCIRDSGIFRAQWLADYYRLRQPSLPGLLAAWQEEGLVVPVNVEALGEMWLHLEALAQLETAPGGKLTASHSAVLSPFDPVVWDRKRAEQLFNFSYQMCIRDRRWTAWQVWLCCPGAILVADPLAVLSQSLWLSAFEMCIRDRI